MSEEKIRLVALESFCYEKGRDVHKGDEFEVNPHMAKIYLHQKRAKYPDPDDGKKGKK